jgi:hypothetical protein
VRPAGGSGTSDQLFRSLSRGSGGVEGESMVGFGKAGRSAACNAANTLP